MKRRQAISYVATLLGGAFSAPTLLAINHQQPKHTDLLRAAAFKLTDIERQIMAEVAEMIIPKTDTPGAKDAQVPVFIEMMLADCYLQPEHTSFVEGLIALQQSQFLTQNEAQRTETLKKIEAENKELMKAYNVQQTKMGDNDDKETMKIQKKGLPFWRLMKELTLLGYFTSEVGIKASFEYVPIPTKFEPIKLKPNQKVYAY
jgi:Gluconate 2-dehydrogenase subunit 3